MADDPMARVALIAEGVDAARWRGWLEAAGVDVVMCSGVSHARRCVPSASVLVVDAAFHASHVALGNSSRPGRSPVTNSDAAPVLVVGDEHARAVDGAATVLPRAASRAAMVGAVLALSAGLRVERGGGHVSGGGAAPATEDPEDAAWLTERPTDRERDVLACAALGLGNRAIAERLGISTHTVKFHLASLYEKLGARGRTEAVRRAVRRGWIAI